VGNLVWVARVCLSSVEGAFQSKRIHDIILAEDDDTARPLLLLLYFEGTARKRKALILVAAQQRQNTQLCVLDPALLLVVLVVAAVEEHILLSGVPMHITVQDYAPLPVQVPDHLFAVVDAFVQEFVWLQPFAVQVAPEQRAAVVALHDAVRVQHRHDFEDEVLAQFAGERHIRKYKLKTAF
jgi:hypothetical protein